MRRPGRDLPVTWITPALLVLGLLAVYAPLADQEFHAADLHLLEGLAHVDRPAAVLAEFGHDHRGSFAPLRTLSLRLDLALFGSAEAAPFLFVNLSLHALNAILLMLALGRLEIRPGIAASVALAFALHPALVDAVAQLAGRGQILATGFLLGGVFLYAGRAGERLNTRTELGILTCLGLGFVSAPAGLLLPLLLLLVDSCRPDGLRATARWLEKLPLLITAGLGLILLLTLNASSAGDPEVPIGHVRRLGAGLLFSLRDLAFPISPGALQVEPTGQSAWSWAFWLPALLAAIAVAARRSGAVAAGVAWTLLCLAPALLHGQTSFFYRNGTWLYPAVPGVAWLVGRLAGSGMRPWSLAALAVLVGWSFVAREQVLAWRSDAALVNRILSVDADNWAARIHRAELGLADARAEDAEYDALRAVELRPDAAWAVVTLADILAARGEPEAARLLYERAVSTRWSDPAASRDLGYALLRAGRPAHARDLFANAAADPEAAAGWALALARLGQADAAAVAAEGAGTGILESRLALAWLRATAPEASLRDPEQALALIDAPAMTGAPARRSEVAAAARAGIGEFAEAFRLAQDAARLFEEDGFPEYARQVRERARLYLQSEDWVEPRLNSSHER